MSVADSRYPSGGRHCGRFYPSLRVEGSGSDLSLPTLSLLCISAIVCQPVSVLVYEGEFSVALFIFTSLLLSRIQRTSGLPFPPPPSIRSLCSSRWGSVSPIGVLKVEVSHPIHDIEEQEWGGKEDASVRVQVQQVEVDASFSPAPVFALLVAAEEALAVLAVQTLVDACVLKLPPVHGVVEGDDGVWRPYIQPWELLERKEAEQRFSQGDFIQFKGLTEYQTPCQLSCKRGINSVFMREDRCGASTPNSWFRLHDSQIFLHDLTSHIMRSQHQEIWLCLVGRLATLQDSRVRYKEKII